MNHVRFQRVPNVSSERVPGMSTFILQSVNTANQSGGMTGIVIVDQ